MKFKKKCEGQRNGCKKYFKYEKDWPRTKYCKVCSLIIRKERRLVRSRYIRDKPLSNGRYTAMILGYIYSKYSKKK